MKTLLQADLNQSSIWYEGRKNTTGTPLIKHVERVALLILEADTKLQELGINARDICRIALAHDALEDTKLTEKQLEKVWGNKVSKSVRELSNSKGDSDFNDYISYLATKASEATLIVKLADILANIENSLIYFETIDINWIRSFWIPLLDKYQLSLFKLTYVKYKGLAATLTLQIEQKFAELRKRSASV